MDFSIPHYLDTSVAVKIVIDEENSDEIRKYIKENYSYHFHITEFAFYEFLSVLKLKWQKKEITYQQYTEKIYIFAGYLNEDLVQIDRSFRMENFKTILEVGELVKKYSIDFSDALQIYTVINGEYHDRIFECKTVFVTADKNLAKAAKSEKIRVWHYGKENPPSVFC